MNEHVLVTGGGGYIGSVLVPMLLADGYRVTVVDRFFFGTERLPQHPNLTPIREDTRRLRPAHFDGVDHVIDLAAISNDPSGELFQDATWAINHRARARCARLAKEAGVSRYVLPSSCSIYGFQAADVISDEHTPINPLTTYAKANGRAEDDVLPLADDSFTVIVLRQATVYGASPRMRFDLAINGMTYGAWSTRKLPLMRSGDQWRPMVHVTDTAAAQMFMLTADRASVNGEVFNVGSESNVYQIGPLGQIVADAVPGDVEIEWYGDPDIRSYRVAFDKVEALGWKAQKTAVDGVTEIVSALEAGTLTKSKDTITLDWYRSLAEDPDLATELAIDGQLFDLEVPS